MNANDIIKQQTRKISIRMSILMNTLNTIIFSTIGTLRSGHFTIQAWLIGAVIGWITGAIVTSIFPPRKVQLWILDKTQTREETWKGKFLSSVATSIIIMPTMSIVMGIAMPMMSAQGLNRAADALQAEVVAMQAEQDELKGQQAALIAKMGDEENPGMQASIDEMQAGIDGLQQGIDGKSQGVAAQRAASEAIKASIWKSLPFSIIFMTIFGIILGMFTQPFFMKIVMKSVLGKENV